MQSTPRLRLDSQPLWTNFRICGASAPGTEGQPEGTPDAPSGDAGKTSETGSADKDIKDPAARIKSLEDEKNRHYSKTQEQERELNELRAFKDEQERAKLTDKEKADRALADAEKAKTSLSETNRRLSIQNAFLMANEVQWHDAADALSLVDLSQVEVADDGTIKNPDVLKAAITDLAKNKAYLVKNADAEEKPKKTPPPSGAAPTGAAPATNGTDLEALRRKYPALRAH